MLNLFSRWRHKSQIRKLRKQYNAARKNLDFDLSALDAEIGKIADRIYQKHRKLFLNPEPLKQNRIGLLATQLYDSGGHTECLINFAKSFHADYELKLFLSRLADSEAGSPVKTKLLKSLCAYWGINEKSKCFYPDIISLYNAIVSFAPKTVFLYIHMDDTLFTAVIHLLKKHTDIKVIFFNHGDHLPSLALSLSDLLIDFRPASQKITIEKRHFFKTHKIPLQGYRKEDTAYISEQQKRQIRHNFGIGENEYMSLTGTAAYKFFNEDGSSDYFAFIKKLLEAEPRLKHVVMTKLNPVQEEAVKSIFVDSPAFERLIFSPLVADYNPIFQTTDIFIDSFPQGSALTHIDMIRNKRPTIIKKNLQNPLRSFEYYLYPDYEYACADLNEMLERTLFLLHTPKEQERIIEKAYQHYLNTFEFEIVKQQYAELIENSDNLAQFYDPLTE